MKSSENIKRCCWVNLKNPAYIKYHDEEWSVPCHDDRRLFEMLILESFQAGLSWECILNKRQAFRDAFDDFDLDKVCSYDDDKISELLDNPKIVRNRLKINAAVSNALVFKKIKDEYGSFSNYIWSFTDKKIIYEVGKSSSPLSDAVSFDLKSRGMKFVGTTIIYSYLQSIGIIYSHDEKCYKYKERGEI